MKLRPTEAFFIIVAFILAALIVAGVEVKCGGARCAQMAGR